jgi:hypothetical protein
MYEQNFMPDTALLLADVAARIRANQGPVDRYLQQSGGYEAFNPFKDANDTSLLHREAGLPDKFWERLGIRHIIFNDHSETVPQGQWLLEADKLPHNWNSLKNSISIERLRAYIGNSSIIQFAGYANVDDAAGFWGGLFENVIKPLNKRDFEFIFHLGDTGSRSVFEVDEIVDIIGDYFSYGRVSLVLEEQEADKLLNKLYGGSYNANGQPDATEKYFFLFNTMRIDVLLILCATGVRLFSKDQQFDFAGSPVSNFHTHPYSWEFFDAGFRIGLLLRLDISHAIVLGQVFSYVCRVNTLMPMTRLLLQRIESWMSMLMKA